MSTVRWLAALSVALPAIGIALAHSEGLGGNEVPEEDRVEGVFELRIQGPDSMLSGSREVYSVILTSGSEIEGSPDGAQGWSFGVGARGLHIVGATTDGTLLRDPVQGYGDETTPNINVIQLTSGEGNEGATALFVIFGSYTLPTTTAVDVLRLDVEARGGELPDNEPALLYFRDDLIPAAATEPVPVAVSREGVEVTPSTRDKEVTLAGRFLRGDANADGSVSMSDAIYTLMGLFVGGFWYRCEKSGDANDDGVLDVSDAIVTLYYLFLGTTTIPAPLGACGLDPTVDLLDCEEFPPCG